MHAGLDLFDHIPILIAHFQCHRSFSVLFVENLYGMDKGCLSCAHHLAAVVTDDIAHIGMFNASAHIGEMEEALVFLSI